MPLNPALLAELQQRRSDLQRRITALENWHNSFTVPDEDPPSALETALAGVWSDLQQVKSDVQGFTVPDEDPPTVAVNSLQGFENELHSIETVLVNQGSPSS